ncbi:MAG TPA: competence/damage-inducible protein A [Gemmatimonadales bacterium]|jgi:nicotinamide-nucleotide amidase|nr:competence/damage-inducible protein A [Gemmatimonadales bacterium]
MDLELVTVGTELLLGLTVDTNSAFLGQALAEIGVRVARRTSVPDEPAAVRDAVREALGRRRLVITTGGLGPTKDDLSKQAVAEIFGLPLEFRPEIWESLAGRWSRLGRKLSERNRCQAEVPRGATVLPNPLGTAPGLWITGAPGEVVMLPGVPSEMRGLVRNEVVPRLAARSAGRVVRSLVLRTTGIPESALAERLAPVENQLAPLTLAYLPSLCGVDLRLTAWDLAPEAANQRLRAAAERLRGPIGEHCYGEGETDLAAVLLDACRAHRLTLAVAESCTGGMVGERITAIPGSSDVFRGGVIAYANGVKESALGVPARILEVEGAVSEGTVRAMAEAARERLRATLAVAVTGVAGPDGGSAEKPVGTVWFGFAGPSGADAERFVFPGSREEIRVRASQHALFGLLRRARR